MVDSPDRTSSPGSNSSWENQDEEQRVGLLSEHYPPPPSPPTDQSPFTTSSSKLSNSHKSTIRPFLVLCALLGLTVLIVSTIHFKPLSYDYLHPKWTGTQSLREQMYERPLNELNQQGIWTVEAKEGPGYTVTAIVLHGLGQPNHETPFVRKMADKFSYVKWVSPTADRIDVTVRDGESTSAWFNIETFDDLYEGEDPREFVHSQRQINALVDEEREKMINDGKEPRIVLMGFSQGAVMTILGVLSTADRYEGGIALSGYVPLVDEMDQVISPAAQQVPLLWLHGLNDPYLTAENARIGVDLLRSDAVGLRNLEFKAFKDLDHIWNELELDYMVDWFRRTIPRERTPSKPLSTLSSSSLPTPSSISSSTEPESTPTTLDPQRAATALEGIELAAELSELDPQDSIESGQGVEKLLKAVSGSSEQRRQRRRW